MLKDELEAIIASDSVWAGRSTLVLAVGILGEYAVLPFLEEKNGHWKRLAKMLCAFLVVAGIVGEYGFSARIANKAGELQRISDQELADAIERAGRADERAFRNEKEAARLNVLAKSLAKETADAKLELARIKTPRSLSPEQQQRMIATLRQFVGQKFCFSVYPDSESVALMRLIEIVLRSAGWVKIPPQLGDIQIEGAAVTDATGLEEDIAPNEGAELGTVLITLASVLRSEGLPSVARTEQQMFGKSPRTINITVGQKPLPRDLSRRPPA